MKLLEITVAVGKREIHKKMWKLNVLLTNISDKKSQGKLENILRQIEIKTQDTKAYGMHPNQRGIYSYNIYIKKELKPLT